MPHASEQCLPFPHQCEHALLLLHRVPTCIPPLFSFLLLSSLPPSLSLPTALVLFVVGCLRACCHASNMLPSLCTQSSIRTRGSNVRESFLYENFCYPVVEHRKPTSMMSSLKVFAADGGRALSVVHNTCMHIQRGLRATTRQGTLGATIRVPVRRTCAPAIAAMTRGSVALGLGFHVIPQVPTGWLRGTSPAQEHAILSLCVRGRSRLGARG